MSTQTASRKLLSTLRGEIEDHGLLGAMLLVAVSGGPDSLALVHALSALREELGLRLHAAHMDHGLRPGRSEADARFVREAMHALNIPLTIGRTDVNGYRRSAAMSVESAARRLRYEFLAATAEAVAAAAVGVGHTRDDQAETVLMHILRGSGLTGLKGMSARSESTVDGTRLVLFRPLLTVGKSDTLAYCAENGLEPRLDESNLSTEYTRNRVRLELIPQLERYNPAVREALSRLAQTASLDHDLVSQTVEQVAPDVMSVRAADSGGYDVSLERGAFRDLHGSIQRHLLRHAFDVVAGKPDDLSFTHIEGMMRVLLGPAGRSLNLPFGVLLVVDYHMAVLSGQKQHPPAAGVPGSAVAVPGLTEWGDWGFRTTVVDSAERQCGYRSDDVLSLSESFDAERIGRELTVRTRIAGDRFHPIGMQTDKRLKNFMKDAHIPRRWRDSIPLVVAGDGRVAWVVGWRMADWCKVTEETKSVLDISCQYDRPFGRYEDVI